MLTLFNLFTVAKRADSGPDFRFVATLSESRCLPHPLEPSKRRAATIEKPIVIEKSVWIVA